jgi:hypothetical protein
MAPRRQKRKFDGLTDAVANGTADDVRRMIADGTHPDDREEADDPTPLMMAAAWGRLEAVEALVDSRADVDALAEDLTGELDQFPFLDDFCAEGRLSGLTALAYAALYGSDQVYEYLTMRTKPGLRAEAEALRRARAESGFVPRPYGAPKKPKSARQGEREELLAASAAARRWVIQCPLCNKQGYKPAMPDEIDKRGTAARIRQLFSPLPTNDSLCENCTNKTAVAMQKIVERQRSPKVVKARQEAEARWQKRLEEMRREQESEPK